MPRKRFLVEQMINHLREADVWLAQGRTVGEVCRDIGISEQSYYRRRQHYNTVWPHSSLGYRPPARAAWSSTSPDPAFATQGLRPDQGLPVSGGLT